MASQTVLKPETTTEIAQAENKNGLIVKAEKLLDRINELYQRIEKRAYELFEERGYETGHDAQDWFRAESEYLTQISVEINEDDTSIVARAQMPDFDEKELNISIEPHHLFIAARIERSIEEEKDEGLLPGESSKVVFCSIALPCEVEADSATAIFKDGLLEISIPKLVARDAEAVETTIE
jgi:HSP20 family protein